jgi:predicted methyltransferase
MRLLVALSLAAALAACAPTAPVTSTAPDYAAALNDSSRPTAERERDAVRKPTELLAFARIAPGQKVGDYIMGGGYWTRILSNVVGPTGKVYAFQPNEFIGFRPAYGDEQEAAIAGRANVDGISGPIAAPPFPEPLDTIITVQNFHDLFIEQMPAGTGPKAIAALYAALKPGGTLVVVDHSAPAATGTTRTSATHRIERKAALDALTKAGFVFEADSDMYADPADPRTANVFDPAIRGKTDQFTLRLRKPL